MVFQKVVIDRCSGSDLIGKPPNGDARVIVVLDNKFFHLRKRVASALFHVHGDVGDFRPYHDTVFIA